jgi:hypothetical protein
MPLYKIQAVKRGLRLVCLRAAADDRYEPMDEARRRDGHRVDAHDHENR